MPSAAAASETALQVRTHDAPAPRPPVRGFDAVEAVWRMSRDVTATRAGSRPSGRPTTCAARRRRSPSRSSGRGSRRGPRLSPRTSSCTSTSQRSSSSGTARGSCSRIADGTGSSSRVERPLLDHCGRGRPFLSGTCWTSRRPCPPGRGSSAACGPWSYTTGDAGAAIAGLLMQLLALVGPEITSVVMNTALPDRARSTLHVVAAGVLLVAAFQACIGLVPRPGALVPRHADGGLGRARRAAAPAPPAVPAARQDDGW